MGDVWLAACHVASAEAEQLFGCADSAALTPAETQRLASITAPRRRRQFLIGHALLRVLVKSCDASNAALLFPVDQAPQMAGARPFRLGLTHSSDWVFAAAATGRIGVDAECYRERLQWRELAQAVCPELFVADAAAPTLVDFYRAWTLKEAWLKSLGMPATPGALQSLRIRALRSDDAYAVVSWPFGAGVMSCLVRSNARFHWPLGRPSGLDAQPASRWAMDVLA